VHSACGSFFDPVSVAVCILNALAVAVAGPFVSSCGVVAMFIDVGLFFGGVICFMCLCLCLWLCLCVFVWVWMCLFLWLVWLACGCGCVSMCVFFFGGVGVLPACLPACGCGFFVIWFGFGCDFGFWSSCDVVFLGCGCVFCMFLLVPLFGLCLCVPV
jgi:hypothetical protein